MDKQSKRIREWVKHPIKVGNCRQDHCDSPTVANTPEGAYCLECYTNLPECMHCGGASTQKVYQSSWICSACQDKVELTDDMILMRSALAGHEEMPGHDTMRGTLGDARRNLSKTLSQNMKKAGYKDLSFFAQQKQRKKHQKPSRAA